MGVAPELRSCRTSEGESWQSGPFYKSRALQRCRRIKCSVSFSNLKAVEQVTEAASLETRQELLTAGSWHDTCACNWSL